MGAFFFLIWTRGGCRLVPDLQMERQAYTKGSGLPTPSWYPLLFHPCIPYEDDPLVPIPQTKTLMVTGEQAV